MHPRQLSSAVNGLQQRRALGRRMPATPLGTRAFSSIKRNNRQMQKVALRREAL